MFFRKRRGPRRGIVLLIALGMLSLFSVLIVSFVVFSSQQSQIAVSAAQQRTENIDPAPIFDAVINTIVAGDANPTSPTFHEDLLGDLWGTDHLRLRVAHQRGGVANPAIDTVRRGQLLQPMLATDPEPNSTLFKFPINLAGWHFPTPATAATPLDIELTSAVTSRLVPFNLAGLQPADLPDYRLNDVFTGRLITFLEGPLQNHTFRVVRYFGADNPTPSSTDPLEACLVIDLAETGSSQIEFNGEMVNIYRLATDSPNALIYGAGPDGAPGAANFNDDGAGLVDDPAEYGTAVTDDVGYVFLMNGLPFNGRGRNATGANVVTIPNPVDTNNANLDYQFDTQFGRELLPNQKVTGVSRQSASAEPDEVYDAADFDNWFLSWQPSDHRRVLPQVAAVTNISPQSAPSVIPSYHRPSVINYLMNAPIWVDENGDNMRDPAELRRFAILDPNITPSDALRLQILYQRIRAACYRPLNFEHAFFSGTTAFDLNRDGDPFDGAPEFNGSNPAGILNTPIDTMTFNNAQLALGQLASWLINGPWDVDNDGDGVADSVWVDFALSDQTLADGTVLRPMVAPLIEDLDGKINLNRAGSWAQITSARFQTANPTSYAPIAGNPTAPDSDYFATARSLQTFGRGSGLGPAEINFSHLFDEYRTGSLLQPQFFTQTSNPRVDVLNTRIGNIFQSRYGGVPFAGVIPHNFAAAPAEYLVQMPGQEVGPTGQVDFSDPLSRLIHPSRRNVHGTLSPMGRAVDMHGRSTMRKDQLGSTRDDFVGNAVPNPYPVEVGVGINEVINQPYEFETDVPVGNDRPFTAAEYHSLVKRGTSSAISRRLVELLGDAADGNEALDRLVSFDSRSLDVVELPGGQSIVQFVIDRLPDNERQNRPDLINEQIERIVALELRKGSRLNLNRPLDNGQNDSEPPPAPPALNNGAIPINNLTDETFETEQVDANTSAREFAFRQIYSQTDPTYNTQAVVRGDYLPIDTAPNGAATTELPSLSAGELLARQMYYLMFRLILDPDVDPDATPIPELVPNFPYPQGMATTGSQADTEFRNRYVAKRLAQWAVNAVDIRDSNAIMTRLRYDPNPFDSDGFDLTTAATNVVWGMERRELGLSENISLHDRRVKRNLETLDAAAANDTNLPPDPNPRQVLADGEYQGDEARNPGDATDSDQELDQFRIPEASSFVELKSLRSPLDTRSTSYPQESYPAELYDLSGTIPRLDLGRIAGTGATRAPVWRLAVGYTGRDLRPTPGSASFHHRSTLWVNEAERFQAHHAAAPVPPATGIPSPWSSPNPLINAATLTAPEGDHMLGQPDSEWAERIRHVSEVTSPIGDNSRVSLYDLDLDPSNPNTQPSEILLERFVAFATVPTTMMGGTSGMLPQNVYTPTGVRDVNGNLDNVNPLLEPGQFAVVAPRQQTHLGSTAAAVAPLWPYSPSEQKFEIFGDVVGGRVNHDFHYFDLNNEYGSPISRRVGGPYRTLPILPIIAVGARPDLVPGANRTDWLNYANNTPNDEEVSVGFNISAPDSGVTYYPAPTNRINDNPGDNYPFIDGYRDYVSEMGVHDDKPFDEWLSVPGPSSVDHMRPLGSTEPQYPWHATANATPVPAPLIDKGWLRVGTYQDVATIFLQRLADPTRAWDAVSNPYITVDYQSMDLTVFNGEEDLDQPPIDRDANGMPVLVDIHTPVYPTSITFDTRRKIPDSRRERPLTSLIPNNGVGSNGLADMGNYRRFLYAQRSPLMALQNVLRDKPRQAAAASMPFFDFELTSAWEDGMPEATNTANLNTGFQHQYDQQRFDAVGDPFPQTLGFVNREFGEPAQAFTAFAGGVTEPPPGTSIAGDFVGQPIGVSMLMPTHSDRPFQSPYELIQVPATSASRMNAEFSPGTVYWDPTTNVIPAPTNPPTPNPAEVAGRFTHLLGFEDNLGEFDAADVVNPADHTNPASLIVDATTRAGFNQLTGNRAGFEQIFDLVDTGPLSFGQRRWFDPERIQRLPSAANPVDVMFNRVVSTLQPPFNYVDRHRTEGKINLNTMPDYVRQGGAYSGRFNPTNTLDFQRPLDAGERPDFPAGPAGFNGIVSEPSNHRVGLTTDPINSAILYGNGSVFRALASGHSTYYELDDEAGSPLAMGQFDSYKRTVDSRFGFGFKAFIESRRGYATSYANSTLAWSSFTHTPNLDLDFRYPSRFAGVFAPAAGATLPSVQKFLRTGGYYPNEAVLRRTHDMSLMRPHPDFDKRLMDDDDSDDMPARFPNFAEVNDDRTRAESATSFAIGVENAPPNSAPFEVSMPPLEYIPNARNNNGGNVPAVNQPGSLVYSVAGTGLFERSQADLHRDLRQMSRDSQFRFQNASRMANLTTHHSNVFMVRFTIGYFEVDPNTGAVGKEYLDPRKGFQRPKGLYMIDRSIPVGYEPGQQHNSLDTVIFSSVEK